MRGIKSPRGNTVVQNGLTTTQKTRPPVAARKATLATRFTPEGVAALRAAAVGEDAKWLKIPVDVFERVSRAHAAYRVITLGPARRSGSCCD